MTVDEIMAQLEKLGSAKAREINKRHGAPDNQFGVNRSEIRKLAAKLKTNHDLALELWATGNVEAMLLATLLMDPKKVSQSDLEKLIKSCNYFQLVDWFLTSVIRQTPHAGKLRAKWAASKNEFTGRAGWSLQTGHVKRGNPSREELTALLDTIEAQMKSAPYRKQEAMNFCLGEIGIHHEAFRGRCIQIGEKLGVFKDYPTSKGCISPYVPTWIAAVVGKK